jgi:hypothetical protein
LESAGVAESQNGRQIEREDHRLLDRREFRTQLGDDGGGALRGVRALLVGLETDDEERLVRRREAVDEVEPDDRQNALDPAMPP